VVPVLMAIEREKQSGNHPHSTPLETIELKPDFTFPCRLQVHTRYSTAQVLAGFDYNNEEQSPAFREGVKYFKDKNLDIFFITLNKSEIDFSPSTLYEDYAINEKLK
jgi:hypothetical protein